LLEVGDGKIGLRREPLRLGGGDDDIVIEQWPAGAAQLAWRDGHPWLEANVETLRRNGDPLTRGSAVRIAPRDQLCIADVTVTFTIASVEPAATHRDPARLVAVSLEMYPQGGTLTLQTIGTTYRVALAERRFSLACVLLQPPAPFKPGDYIPDELVVAMVWPRTETANRGDLNQLVARLRQDVPMSGSDGSLTANAGSRPMDDARRERTADAIVLDRSHAVEHHHRPDLDGAVAEPGVGDARCDLRRLVEIFRLDDVEAAERLAGLGERAVGGLRLATAYAHRRRRRDRMERFACPPVPRLLDVVGELHVLAKGRVAIGFGHVVPGLLRVVDEQHVLHRVVPFTDGRTATTQIDIDFAKIAKPQE
jgi:hypothetical protein